MVRANHPGVICISTCEKREIGGFQIIPLTHTYSAEMQRMRGMYQYLVLRGVNFENLTGRAPFFRGFMRPGDIDAGNKAGLVTYKINGEWHEMQNIPGLTDNALADVEAFRIYLKAEPYERLTSDFGMTREEMLKWLREPYEPSISDSPEDVWEGF
jgi:hypothetical protein